MSTNDPRFNEPVPTPGTPRIFWDSRRGPYRKANGEQQRTHELVQARRHPDRYEPTRERRRRGEK